MDASQIMVGGLTTISIALLVWMEIRSRRNSAATEQNAPSNSADPEPPPQKQDLSRRGG